MALIDLSNPDGKFSILAIDHRDSLRYFLRPDNPESLGAAEITALKIELVSTIADLATGVRLENVNFGCGWFYEGAIFSKFSDDFLEFQTSIYKYMHRY